MNRDDIIRMAREAGSIDSEDVIETVWAAFAAAEREQAEPEPKPVAWMCPEDPDRETAFSWEAGHCEICGKQRISLYTAPPQRPPLTDEELDALAIDKDGLPNSHLEFARAIERAHGIGEEE